MRPIYRLALDSGWDDDLLQIELGALRDDGFDLGLTGFDTDEIAGFLAAPTGDLTDPNDLPPPPAVPVACTGDAWRLGRHRLVCGDSIDAAAVAVALAGATRA